MENFNNNFDKKMPRQFYVVLVIVGLILLAYFFVMFGNLKNFQISDLISISSSGDYSSGDYSSGDYSSGDYGSGDGLYTNQNEEDYIEEKLKLDLVRNDVVITTAGYEEMSGFKKRLGYPYDENNLVHVTSITTFFDSPTVKIFENDGSFVEYQKDEHEVFLHVICSTIEIFDEYNKTEDVSDIKVANWMEKINRFANDYVNNEGADNRLDYYNPNGAIFKKVSSPYIEKQLRMVPGFIESDYPMLTKLFSYSKDYYFGEIALKWGDYCHWQKLEFNQDDKEAVDFRKEIESKIPEKEKYIFFIDYIETYVPIEDILNYSHGLHDYMYKIDYYIYDLSRNKRKEKGFIANLKPQLNLATSKGLHHAKSIMEAKNYSYNIVEVNIIYPNLKMKRSIRLDLIGSNDHSMIDAFLNGLVETVDSQPWP